MARKGLMAILLTALLAGGAEAEEKTKAGTPEAHPSLRKIDIDFPGGTVLQLVDLVERQLQTKANVIVSEDAKGVILPPFSLRSVTGGDIFRALQMVISQKGTRLRVCPSGSITTIMGEKKRSKKVEPKPAVRLYNVADLLRPYKIDDIVTAIETAWALQGDKGPETKVKFHEETQLLIVVCKPLDVRLIENVLSELRKGPKSRTKYVKDPASWNPATKALVEKYKAENALLKSRMEDRTALEQRNNARLHQNIQAYERQIADLRARIRALSMEIEALEKALEAKEAKKR